MNIRAGIIYNVAHIEHLTKQQFTEIFFWSNRIEIINECWHYNQIKKLGDVSYPAPVDFDPKMYFKNINIDELSVNMIAYYFIECEPSQLMRNPISNWNPNTYGLQIEKKTIQSFNMVYGYNISSVRRKTYNIPDTDIVISGTPDGEILSSPGGIFDGYLVEIKFQRGSIADVVNRNKYQIAAYSIIFDKPVLIIVFSDFKYRVYRYTKQTLRRFWETEVLPKFLPSATNIRKSIKLDHPADIEKYFSYLSNFQFKK